jgi:hypothetical protein
LYSLIGLLPFIIGLVKKREKKREKKEKKKTKKREKNTKKREKKRKKKPFPESGETFSWSQG